MSLNLLEKYRTEIFASLISIIFLITGIISPSLIPDELNYAPPGFKNTTWIKTFIAFFFIGMGLLCFTWLVVIHRFILRKSKKEYMY